MLRGCVFGYTGIRSLNKQNICVVASSAKRSWIDVGSTQMSLVRLCA